MCNHNLEETLQLAITEYNARQQQFQELQQELLVRTGSIQTLQKLIAEHQEGWKSH
ncbi:hypothetical protein SynBIOSU31_00748 [Synechococcus sp. BIOS-U3-1]|nr:hypothetical protein SynBIOSU31_00748 [Synechococcus sp. BIOS-U3-1]